MQSIITLSQYRSLRTVMASLRFEGDFEDLTDIQLQFIRNVLDKRGYVDNKVVFAPVGQVGDNYAANVKRITVHVENGDNFQLIAKIATSAEQLRTVMNTGLLFNNEAVMYDEVLPRFRKLQEAAEVSEEEKLRYAECYGVNRDPPNEVVLLEDLKLRNYAMLDKYKSLPNDAVKLILKNFAILHSLSYALKKSDPDTYNSYKNQLQDLWSQNVDMLEYEAFGNLMEDSLLAIFEDDLDKYKNALKGAVKSLNHYARRLRTADANSKYAVIQQGDAWTNNMMFKLENDEIKECMMIDYQLSNGTNPVCDILYMIFNCTDYETRSKHFYEWLDYYHDQLDKSLQNYGLKALYAYPRDQLDADIKRYSRIFFGTALILFTIILRKTDEAALVKDAFGEDINKLGDSMSVANLSTETANFVKTRVRDLIDSYIDFGFIKSNSF